MSHTNAEILHHLILSDKAHFHLNVYTNKQNFRYWTEENPRLLHETPLHSEKVTVGWGVIAFCILEPCLFQNGGRQSVMVTSDRYVVMLQECLHEELCQGRTNMRVLWFRQEGDTAHMAMNSMETVREMFLEHVSFWRHSMACAVTRFISM
jgi:hypothetical protein